MLRWMVVRIFGLWVSRVWLLIVMLVYSLMVLVVVLVIRVG